MVNITNTFLDLRGVIERAASHFGKIAVLDQIDASDDNFMCFASGWVIVADPSLRQLAPEWYRDGELLRPNPGFRMWTDDYSSLWGILH